MTTENKTKTKVTSKAVKKPDTLDILVSKVEELSKAVNNLAVLTKQINTGLNNKLDEVSKRFEEFYNTISIAGESPEEESKKDYLKTIIDIHGGHNG